MSPRPNRDLFNRAANLFLEVIDRPPEQRLKFLEAACGDDHELRERVCSLLANYDKGPVLEEPGEQIPAIAADQAAPVAGERGPRYRILERIGEGGMSAVYRAEDTILDRVVALKFLAPHLVNNPDGMKRFEREAKAAAALDHPNICPVYDIDEAGGRPFIAMAYLQGKTLAERLHYGPLEVDEAIDIAIQVCRGLAAAHSKQIVHRDIKPANLMITETTGAERLVRILDFGIARLSQQSAMTAAGLTMGTISYIAPEQIQQSEVDQRADLWALGVVMYRMVAGELPFQGDTTRDVVAAIAGMDPKDLSSRRDGLPRALDAIVDKALRKDPEQRYQAADEFLADLLELQDSLKTKERLAGVAQAAGDRTRKRRLLAWAGAAILALALIFAVARLPIEGPSPAATPVPFTSYVGLEGDPAISPDGTRIAFTWNGESQSGEPDIYVQLIGTLSPLRLTNTPYGEFRPVWSPDGKEIAFLRYVDYRSSIVIVPALGGPEKQIALAEPGVQYSSMDWSPAANLLAADENGKIITISVDDRSKHLLSFPKQGDRDSVVKFDPTGRLVAFLRYHADAPTELMVVPATGGTARAIGKPGTVQFEFCWTSDGTALVYAGHPSADGGPIRALRVRDGTPLPLRVDVDNAASPDVRGNLLAYTRRIFAVNIWAAEVGPAASSRSRSPIALIASSRRDHSPQFSPDGQSIVFASTRSGSVQIWRSDRQGRNPVQLTFAKGRSAGTPRWSPDGRWIAFDGTIEDVHPDIYVVDANGGPARRITRDPAEDILPSWSSDGHWIYFCSDRRGAQDIWKIPAEGGQAVQVTRHGGWEAFASSDGKYLYYSGPKDRKPIHRLDLATGEDVELPQLGDAGARRYWALAKKGIFFVNTLDNAHWVQYLDFASRKITRVQKIGEIIRYGPGGLCVSPDGRTVLWVQTDQDDQDIMLVRNFK